MAHDVDVSVRSDTGFHHLVDAVAALSRVLVTITARTLTSLDIDITLSQYRTVVVLAARGPQRTVDLALELGVHPSTVTRVSDRLIRRGLVYRRHGERDRRVAWLILTEQGKALAGEVMRRRMAAIRELVELAPAGDYESVAALIDGLVATAGELPEPQWWGRWSESTVVAG